MNIITSNSISTNCILGTVKVNVFLLNKDKNNTVFGQSKNVTFYVADDSIILKSPILGSTFLFQNQDIIDYHSFPNQCNITASLINDNNTAERMQLQVSNNDTDIRFTNTTEITANKNEKYIFETKQICYGQLKGYFQNHQEFLVPQGSYLINNFPTVNFHKKNSRWQPYLVS